MDIFEQSNISNSFHLLKALFDGAIDGIMLINEKGIIEAINPAAAKLFGYNPDEVINQNIKMLMPEPDHSRHDNYLKNYTTTGIKKIIGIGREVKGKRKDGSIFPFRLSVSEVKNSEQRLFAGVVHDISEIEVTNKQLESSKKRLEAIIQTAVDSIIIIDAKGTIQDANPAVVLLFQYEKSEMVGNNVNMLMPEPDHSAHDSYLTNYHTTHQPQIIGTGRDVKGKRKDGTIFPLRLSVSEFMVDGEKFFAGIIHDQTQQKAAEQKIYSLNKELETKVKERTEELADVVNRLLSTNNILKLEVQERKEIEKELQKNKEELEKLLEKEKELGELKSRFVSTASHEFKTPLSTILSSVSLISRYIKEDEQPKRDKHIHRIKQSVKHLNGILDDFLSLGKLEEGKIKNVPADMEWQPFIQEILDEIKVTLKAKQFISYISSGINNSLHLDKKLLKNILFNLFSNASKYSSEGKEIILHVSLEKQILSIHIQDFGMGIPKADQVHLFERFYRAENASTIKGTGLGLNIVQQYIKLMNGSISFKSEEHKGTTFDLKIPIQ